MLTHRTGKPQNRVDGAEGHWALAWDWNVGSSRDGKLESLMV